MLLPAPAFASNTYAVGTCEPHLTSYSTISSAVSRVPAGAVIEVCPGNYPEQVLITKPLTLRGVLSAGSSAAVVAVPSGGLTQSVMSPSCPFSPLYYQILVQQTSGPVDISNLVVDGTGGNEEGCLAGIYYQDASGRLSDVTTQNQGGSFGFGIFAETILSAAQDVTIENNVVLGFSYQGVTANSNSGPLTVDIKGNTVESFGDETSGVYVSGVAGGTIRSNLITTGANNGGNVAGIFLHNAAIEATANTVIEESSTENNDYAFLVEGGSVEITKNRIDAGGQLGLNLQNTGTNSIVEQNTIVNSSSAITGCADTLGYTVSHNTVIDAAVGIQIAGGNVSAPNTFYATPVTTASCP